MIATLGVVHPGRHAGLHPGDRCVRLPFRTPTDVPGGVVEFVARYKIVGRAHRLHETSRFIVEEGRWLYLEAVAPD